MSGLIVRLYTPRRDRWGDHFAGALICWSSSDSLRLAVRRSLHCCSTRGRRESASSAAWRRRAPPDHTGVVAAESDAIRCSGLPAAMSLAVTPGHSLALRASARLGPPLRRDGDGDRALRLTGAGDGGQSGRAVAAVRPPHRALAPPGRAILRSACALPRLIGRGAHRCLRRRRRHPSLSGLARP